VQSSGYAVPRVEHPWPLAGDHERADLQLGEHGSHGAARDDHCAALGVRVGVVDFQLGTGVRVGLSACRPWPVVQAGALRDEESLAGSLTGRAADRHRRRKSGQDKHTRARRNAPRGGVDANETECKVCGAVALVMLTLNRHPRPLLSAARTSTCNGARIGRAGPAGRPCERPRRSHGQV